MMTENDGYSGGQSDSLDNIDKFAACSVCVLLKDYPDFKVCCEQASEGLGREPWTPNTEAELTCLNQLSNSCQIEHDTLELGHRISQHNTCCPRILGSSLIIHFSLQTAITAKQYRLCVSSESLNQDILKLNIKESH